MKQKLKDEERRKLLLNNTARSIKFAKIFLDKNIATIKDSYELIYWSCSSLQFFQA